MKIMASMATDSLAGQTIKKDRLPLIAAILVFISETVLLIYLLGMRFYSPMPTAVFWVLIITAIAAIVFQIVRIPWPNHEPLLVAEILLFGMTLHLIYQIPLYRFTGHDPIQYFNLARQIIENGILLPDKPGAATTISWPLMMVWNAEAHYITGVELFSMHKWVPSLVAGGTLIFLLYIFLRKVFKNTQVALLAILLMVTVPYFIFEGANFKSEVFALTIMLTGFYFLTRAEEGDRTKFALLSIVSLFGVMFSHHATPFLMFLFLVVYLVIIRVLNSLSSRRQTPISKPTLTITTVFMLLAFVGVFSYWIYVNESFLRALINLGETLVYGAPGASSLAETSYVVDPGIILTPRGHITFWGYYIFYAAFTLILLYGLFTKGKEKSMEFHVFIVFLLTCGAWGFIQSYVAPAGAPLVVTVERLIMLGWIWGLAPLAICVLESRRKWGRQLGLMLFAAFMLFNIYTLGPIYWDFQAPGKAEGHISVREDYALAETMAFTAEGATFKFTRMAIYDTQVKYSKDLSQVKPEQLDELDWIAIKKRELQSYREGYYRFIEAGRTSAYNIDLLNKVNDLVTKESPGERNRIYDSDNIVVFK